MILPSDKSYNSFISILTGYRSTVSLIKAIELGVIEAIGLDGSTVTDVIKKCNMRKNEGERFLQLLRNIGIIEEFESNIYLSLFSREFLNKESEINQLAAIAFEPQQIENWNNLDKIIKNGQGSNAGIKSNKKYYDSLRIYQSAMHNAAVIRSKELWNSYPVNIKNGLIVDFGTGDNTYLKEFLKINSSWKAIGCDLSDVLNLNHNTQSNISEYSINLLEKDEMEEFTNKYNKSASIVLLSNLMHCYSETENLHIINFAKKLLTENGAIIVHDFFTDINSFGAIYDVHMMVNTYNGKTYSTKEVSQMFRKSGFKNEKFIELDSSSLAMIFYRNEHSVMINDHFFYIKEKAKALTFFKSTIINPNTISVEPWIKAKCKYGCMYNGKKWSCPPHSMTTNEFKELLSSYTSAILVAGEPPLKTFQKRLIELEKEIFLSGSKKALAFTGGPCSWCEECHEKECRFPEKRRPSLESCGCDVFKLAEENGIPIQPLKNDNDFVTYIGLILID